MPFSETEKTRFVALLQSKGWVMREGTIWAPSEGLWFDDSHLQHWNPGDVQEIFARRAIRIEQGKIGDWQINSEENRQASWAAAEALKQQG